MYTASALLDAHERAHRSLERLLRHCAPFSAEEMAREIPGFGYPNLLQQFDHLIGAEEYWIHVVRGTYEGGEEGGDHPTVPSLEAYRVEVARETEDYLRGASDAELNTARDMLTWQGKVRTLVPARVCMRTMMHVYQHQGQALAMCRLLGRPGPGNLDFPLD